MKKNGNNNSIIHSAKSAFSLVSACTDTDTTTDSDTETETDTAADSLCMG